MALFGKKGSLSKGAHIKRGTQGSSNEVSLSVLDAARDVLDAEQGEAPRQKLGEISLFTLDGNESSNIAVSSSAVSGLSLQEGESSGTGLSQPAAAPAAAAPAAPAEDARARKQAAKQAKREAKAQAAQLRAQAEAASLGRHAKPRTEKSIASMPQQGMEQRVVQKKARRRVQRAALIGGLVLVVAIACAVAGYFLHQNSLEQQKHVAVLDQALAQIEAADETLVQLSNVLAMPNEEGAVETLQSLQTSLPQTKLTLQRAQSLLQQGAAGLQNEVDKEAAVQAGKAIEARQGMCDSGLVLVGALLTEKQEAATVNAAWEDLLKADAQARENATLLLDPTEENLNKATEGITEVISAFQQVQYVMTTLNQTATYADMAPYLSYLDARLTALDHAKAAIEALKVEDLDVARAEQDAYSKADAEATDWALKLPSNPSAPIEEAYTVDVAPTVETYTQQRNAAGSADDTLRSYYSSAAK